MHRTYFGHVRTAGLYVLRSSAGSGKTHALAKHYLGLVLGAKGPDSYRQVLALTFTNKAAAEMRERVLHYLRLLAQQQYESAPVQDVLSHLLDLHRCGARTIAERAAACHGHMLHHWSDISISTIDAFMRRVVKPFVRDLRLAEDLAMSTDQKGLYTRAVERLLEKAGVDPQLTVVLADVCMQLVVDEGRWRPDRVLIGLSDQLDQEKAVVPLQLLSEVNAEFTLALGKKLRERTSGFRDQVRQLGKDALARMEQSGLQNEDLYNTSKGPVSYFRKLAKFDTEMPELSKTSREVLEEGRLGRKSGSDRNIMLANALAPEWLLLHQAAEEAARGELQGHVIRQAVLQQLMPSMALSALHQCTEEIKQEEGVSFFSDLTRRVAEIVQTEPVPFLYERLGERYRHFLVDEFQDTSVLQWLALLPLVENALGNGGSALLVGDPKQAIYRWRNGEVRQFVQLPELFGKAQLPMGAQRERVLLEAHRPMAPLKDNHRSAQCVVQFNNALFGHLGAMLPEALRGVYKDHAQHAVRTLKGLVHIETCTGTKAMATCTLEAVQEALADGYAPGGIAVLVRTKKVGAAVAQHLLLHGLRVASNEALLMKNDLLVVTVLHLLGAAHNGQDPAVALAAQGMVALKAYSESDASDPHTLVEQHLARHAWSPLLTLTETVARLAASLGTHPGSDAHLQELLDMAHKWSTHNGQGIAAFLDHWNTDGNNAAVPATADPEAVQVLTIHASKGLQFPVVIVPSTRMTAGGKANDLLWVDPREHIPELPAALVRETATLAKYPPTELEEEMQQRMLDDLDHLYVAFTRSEDRLYAFLPEEKRDDHWSRKLRAYVQQRVGNDAVYREGEREQTARKVAPATDPRSCAKPREVAPFEWRRNAVLRTRAPETWEPERPDPFRAWGNAVHATLARVSHAGDLERALRLSSEVQLLSPEERQVLRKTLAELLAKKELHPWFAPHLSVATEAGIIQEDGHVLRPDRVVWDGDRIRVLEIKTGAPRPEHLQQATRYRELVSGMGYANVEAHVLYVPDGSIVPA
jgi:ATP-dependent exoDNAse (exonuclease V) beta subunit